MLTQPSSLLSWTFQLFYRSINTNDDDILCILSRRPMILVHSVSTEAAVSTLTLRAIHFFKLRDSPIEAVLHSIAKIEIRLPNLAVGHGQDRLYVL